MSSLRQLMGSAAGSRLFFNERDSDVAICVEWEGERWQFPAHRLMLSSMSEVFRVMLGTDMIEGRSRSVTIRDASPYVVKQFLRYIYMGVVEFNNWTEAVDLLKIAHKYGVQPLVTLSEAYLVANVIFSNVCALYELARTYSLKLLKKQTQLMILDAGFVVSATEGFFHLKSKSLQNFLNSDNFNMEDEGSILTCLREWAVCECSRRCVSLSRSNVLAAMEPFFKYIRWDLIPEHHRTFIPKTLIEKYEDERLVSRKSLYVASSLQYHMTFVKLVVELGSFLEPKTLGNGNNLTCLKFSVDNHIFLTGFRLVGLFKMQGSFSSYSFLILSREDTKTLVQFNLNSLTWSKGAEVGTSVWKEMIAYLPYPIRVDPFSTYTFTLRSTRQAPSKCGDAKWPKTRLDSENIHTNLGVVNFRTYGSCFGITQLFVLPAPPYRNICNNVNDS